MEQERRRFWSFTIGEHGGWAWRVLNPDNSADVSPRRFPTLKACLDDARAHGYALPPEAAERRSERRVPPSVMISQEVRCPWCRHTWDLSRAAFVGAGERITCRHGCGDWIADANSVTCCVEGVDGLLEIPLPTPGV